MVEDALHLHHLAVVRGLAPEVLAAHELRRLDRASAGGVCLAEGVFVLCGQLFGQVASQSAACLEGAPEILLVAKDALLALAHLAGGAEEFGVSVGSLPLA